MTTYSAIADSAIDPESPIDTTLLTNMRDNPLAIAEGDPTAPDINLKALTSDIISTGSQAVADASTWTPSAGLYQFALSGTPAGVWVEIQVSSVWYQSGSGTGDSGLGFVICDGANVRIINTSGASQTVRYHKFSA